MYKFPLKRLSHLRQWLAGFQVLLIVLVLGTNIGWTCPFIGRLENEDLSFVATKHQISWVASLVNLMRPVGTFTGALSNNYFGCKNTIHFLSAAFYLAACICLVFATTVDHIYVTQIFSGLGLGSLFTIYPLYITEIANSNIRGALLSMVMQGYLIGVVVGNFLGAYLEPWIYAVVNISLILIFVMTFFIFPQTPTRLLLQNKREEALKSLKWYQEETDAESKLKELDDFLKSKPELQIMDTLKNLTTPVNRKVMLILFVTYGLLQFSGILTILQYSDIIFKDAGVNIMRPAILVIMMGIFAIPGCWIAMYTSDKFGRTRMLCFSCVLLAMVLLVWGVNFQLHDLGYDIPQLQWVVVIAALLFRVSLSIGVLGVPQILVSELLAPNVNNVGSCICNVCYSIFSFLSNKTFQVMVDTMTYKNVFYLFATLTVLVGVYAIVFIPETKGLSLQEIQDMLEKKYSKKKKVEKVSNDNVPV